MLISTLVPTSATSSFRSLLYSEEDLVVLEKKQYIEQDTMNDKVI